MIIEIQTEKYRCRFFDHFDEDSRQFEDRLRSDPMLVESIPWPRISFWQGYRNLQSIANHYFVLQMLRKDSNKIYQMAVIHHASRIPGFSRGVIPYWIPSLEPGAREDQAELLRMMLTLCREHASLMSLRVHSYIPGDPALDVAESILRESGFEACDREAAGKTRIVDLRPPIGEVLAQFSAKVRTKLKVKKPEEVSVAELATRDHIPELQAALNDSFQRSASEQYNYDFESLFTILEKSPEAAAAFGFFLSDDLKSPKAFVTGVASSPLFEYTLAGSRSNARLRLFKFNYILLWRLVESAKARGALTFDMGGITDGSPGDPLAGISDFERRFPGFEVSIGRGKSIGTVADEMPSVFFSARFKEFRSRRPASGPKGSAAPNGTRMAECTSKIIHAAAMGIPSLPG